MAFCKELLIFQLYTSLHVKMELGHMSSLHAGLEKFPYNRNSLWGKKREKLGSKGHSTIYSQDLVASPTFL